MEDYLPVTVITCIYNGERHLCQAIESILVQTFSNFEYLIIDDASNDNTPSILDQYSNKDARIKIIRNPTNLGLTKSLNIGLKEAQGKYIANLDADNYCDPQRIEKQYRVMEDTGADLCFCGARRFNDEGSLERFLVPGSPLELYWKSLFQNAFGPHSSVMFRLKSILQYGGYDETVRYAQDYDLWERCAAGGLLFNFLPDIMVHERWFESSISQTKNLEQRLSAEQTSLRALGRLLNYNSTNSEHLKILREIYLKEKIVFDSACAQIICNDLFRLASSFEHMVPLAEKVSSFIWHTITAKLKKICFNAKGFQRLRFCPFFLRAMAKWSAKRIRLKHIHHHYLNRQSNLTTNFRYTTLLSELEEPNA